MIGKEEKNQQQFITEDSNQISKSDRELTVGHGRIRKLKWI